MAINPQELLRSLMGGRSKDELGRAVLQEFLRGKGARNQWLNLGP